MRARDDNLLKRHGYLVPAKGLENHSTKPENHPRFLGYGNKRQAQFEFCFFFPIAVNSITIWTSLPSRPDVFVWLPKFLESPMHKENCKISVGVVMKPEVLPSLCLYRKMHSALDQFLLSLIFLIISLQCIAIRGHC